MASNWNDSIYVEADNRFPRHDARFRIERKPLASLPTINIAPFMEGGEAAERTRIAGDIRRACIDIGFFYLFGHGIPESELDELIVWSLRFFELPLEQKMRVLSKNIRLTPGFVPSSPSDSSNCQNRIVDVKERLAMSRDVLPGERGPTSYGAGWSEWPDRTILPGFEAFMRVHMYKRIMLAQQLVRAFALSLDLAEGYFDEFFRYPTGTMIVNYYPSLKPKAALHGRWSFSPHTDYGAFTLLSQDSVGGLQVRNSIGEWIDVAPVAGALIANIGDMFAMWTNDLYSSTRHRAANGNANTRISVPFFVSPHPTTLIRCLDTCQKPENPPRYRPVTAGTYSRVVTAQSHRPGRSGGTVHTVDRFRVL